MSTRVVKMPTHYAGTFNLRAFRWVVLKMFPTSADADKHEKQLCRRAWRFAGYTRVVPAAGHRWAVEAREDVWSNARPMNNASVED